MILEYVVKDNDTVQKIAQNTLGSAGLWTEIVLFNQLDYPFITSDQSYVTEVRASGVLAIKTTSTPVAPIVIPYGTRVQVPDSGRLYSTQKAVTIPIGGSGADVPVICDFAGIWGNTAEDTITVTSIPGVTVSNPDALTNGAVHRVKKTGEVLLIHTNGELGEVVIDLETNYDDLIGEEDLGMVSGDLVTDRYGDLASVKGVLNIMLAIRDRFNVPMGALVRHPNHGTRVHQLIARKDPFLKQLLEVEVIETIQQVRGVVKAEIENLVISGQTVEVVGRVTLQGQTDAQIIEIYKDGDNLWDLR